MTTRKIDLNRTVAAIIDAHIRWDTTTVRELMHRDDDTRWAPDLAYISARLALDLAGRTGDQGTALASFMQAFAAPRITDKQMTDPEIRNTIEEGIFFATDYVAQESVRILGHDAAEERSRQVMEKLAVAE